MTRIRAHDKNIFKFYDTERSDGNVERFVTFYLGLRGKTVYGDGVHHITHNGAETIRLLHVPVDNGAAIEEDVALRDGEQKSAANDKFWLSRCGYWVTCRFVFQKAKTFGERRNEANSHRRLILNGILAIAMLALIFLIQFFFK